MDNRPKIGFDDFFTLSAHKLIPKDISVFSDQVILSIKNFICAIPPAALELHPIFDHQLIGHPGVYKRWWIPDLKDVSVMAQITCIERRGTLSFFFEKGPTIISDFTYQSENTILDATFYISKSLLWKRTIFFTTEILFRQRVEPVLVRITTEKDKSLLFQEQYFGVTKFSEDEAFGYDYFLFMDRLFRIDNIFVEDHDISPL